MTDKTPPRSACCGNCNAWERARAMQPLGYCHAKPPTLILLGMAPGRVAGAPPQPVTDSYWPMTQDVHWCREHEPATRPFTAIDMTKINLSEMAEEGTG